MQLVLVDLAGRSFSVCLRIVSVFERLLRKPRQGPATRQNKRICPQPKARAPTPLLPIRERIGIVNRVLGGHPNVLVRRSLKETPFPKKPSCAPAPGETCNDVTHVDLAGDTVCWNDGFGFAFDATYVYWTSDENNRIETVRSRQQSASSPRCSWLQNDNRWLDSLFFTEGQRRGH